MMRYFTNLVFFILLSVCESGCNRSNPISSSSNKIGDPFPDEVILIRYGEGAGFGQNFFPNNILGPPDTSARATIPSANEQEILSLGSGGEIILKFNDGGIKNGEGPDFTIFENVFKYGLNHFYRETAFVSVSVNGMDWYQFPYDSITFQGLAGVNPTNGDKNYRNPFESGGDPFDLLDVGLSCAYYLKITDTNGRVVDSGPSFDLDAVVVIHGEDE